MKRYLTINLFPLIDKGLSKAYYYRILIFEYENTIRRDH